MSNYPAHAPHSVQAVPIHTLWRETLRGWQRASSPQINRNTCGLWKWGFLCYCFTKWSFSPQSSFCLIYPTPHPLPPATHTHFCLTNTCRQTPHTPPFPQCCHTHTRTLYQSPPQSLWNRWWCGGSGVSPPCLPCSETINTQSYERFSCHHCASHRSCGHTYPNKHKLLHWSPC